MNNGTEHLWIIRIFERKKKDSFEIASDGLGR